MVNAGGQVCAALERAFGEEARDSSQKCGAERQELEKQLHRLQQERFVVYKGYVDDPRNTDNNVWIETESANHHDETGNHGPSSSESW